MEDGWSYGSVPLAYILACLVWVLPVVLLFFFGWISLAIAAIVGVLGVIILPIVSFRLTKRIWIGTYYAILPFEMRYRKPGEKGDAH